MFEKTKTNPASVVFRLVLKETQKPSQHFVSQHFVLFFVGFALLSKQENKSFF
jgi:hypothetical protein